MRKILVAAMLGLVLLLLLSAARPAAATHGDLSGLYGGNLRVSVRGALNLNPFTATDADSWKVIPLVYDSLARIDPVTQLPAPWARAAWGDSGAALTVPMRASLALLSGNLDFIGWGLSVDDPGTIYNIGGTNRSLLFDATIVNNPGFTQLVVGFNLRSGRTTSDSEFRLALADTLSPLLARQAHANTIVSRSPVINEAIPWFNPNLPVYQVVTTEYPAPTYLLTDQNQRLDSAGYFARNGDGIREKPDGSALSLVAIGIPVAESSRIFTIQASTVDVFSRLGLAVSLESVPSASLPARLASGNFDVFIASLPTDLDPGFLSDYFGSAGSKNYVHVLDSALDTSLQSANVALATASRQSGVMSVQDRVMNGGDFVPLIHLHVPQAAVRVSI